MKAHFFETVEKTCVFFDKRLAVCCAHNLPASGGQIPHWQTEKYFLSRTCRERKWLSKFLPPAGGKRGTYHAHCRRSAEGGAGQVRDKRAQKEGRGQHHAFAAQVERAADDKGDRAGAATAPL